jgi:hypothetical protein
MLGRHEAIAIRTKSTSEKLDVVFFKMSTKERDMRESNSRGSKSMCTHIYGLAIIGTGMNNYHRKKKK